MKREIAIAAAIAAMLFVLPPGARAQVPPSVDIPIPNIVQPTQAWCWAAVAQQVMHATRGPAQALPQCALVAMASGIRPAMCCGQPDPVCLREASFSQIAALIGQLVGRSASYAQPSDPMTLYQTLASGRPIVLHVRSGVTGTHVVVLRGMSFVQTKGGSEPVLHINDPLDHFTQPVPFSRLLPMWIDAIVVD